MQLIQFTGNLTKDPTTAATPSGLTACSFTVAVNRYSRKNPGEEETDFFHCNTYGKLAENCSRFLKKGKKVYALGELRPKSVITENGESFLFLEVYATHVSFLSPKDKDPEDPSDPILDNLTPDDIPF